MNCNHEFLKVTLYGYFGNFTTLTVTVAQDPAIDQYNCYFNEPFDLKEFCWYREDLGSCLGEKIGKIYNFEGNEI